jgi:hypothetical protein
MMRYENDDDAFDERGVIKPGRAIRVPILAMDAAQIAADGIPLDHHRPGYRFVGDRSAQDAAYTQMIRRQEAAWKTPAQAAADIERASQPPVCTDERENAYEQHRRWLENAWRGAR